MIAACSIDAHRGLGQAIAALFHPAAAEIRTSSESRWSSVTFTGARHRYALAVSGEGAGAAVHRAAKLLSRQDFPLEGHVVADIALTEQQVCGPALIEVELEALTVEAN